MRDIAILTATYNHPRELAQLYATLLDQEDQGFTWIVVDDGSRTAGTVDVIDEGVTGYLFEAGNADDLTSTVEKVIAMSPEERAAMEMAGRAKVEKEFDRQAVVSKYMSEVENA